MRTYRNDFGFGVALAWWENSIKVWEVAFAAPQVIALRTAQFAAAAPFFGSAGAREAAVMGPEKIAAFAASWQAMMAQGLHVQQHLLQQMLAHWWHLWPASTAPRGRGRPDAFRATVVPVSTGSYGQAAHAAARVASAGIAPVHRRVTSNVRRLVPRKGG